MEAILGWAAVLFIIFLMLALIYIWFEEFLKDVGYYIRYELPDKIKTLLSIFKPKSPLDKEIAETEREIEFLKAQDAKIEHLKALDAERDKLYRKVKEGAHSEYVDNLNRGDWSLSEETIEIENGFKKEEPFECAACGGTKVTGYSTYDRDGVEYSSNSCADCGTPIN